MVIAINGFKKVKKWRFFYYFFFFVFIFFAFLAGFNYSYAIVHSIMPLNLIPFWLDCFTFLINSKSFCQRLITDPFVRRKVEGYRKFGPVYTFLSFNFVNILKHLFIFLLDLLSNNIRVKEALEPISFQRILFYFSILWLW